MNLVNRSEWGARAPRHKDSIGGVYGIAIHWEGPRMGSFPHDLCDDKVRGIQRFHMDSRGWNDIAYNFLVCPHGAVFEGRGLWIRSAAQGTNEGNGHYYAACYLGGQGDPFTAEAKRAFNELIGYVQANGAGKNVKGHREFHATACPGEEIFLWLKANRPSQGSSKPLPKPTPRPQPRDDDKWFEEVIMSLPTLDFNRSPKSGLVDNVQGLLCATGRSDCQTKIDGDAGKDTLRAVKAFQKAAGLDADGVVGRNTWKKLITW